MAGLHISVSLSGGASLGAYQAGTMAALLVAVEHLQVEEPDAVKIDAFGGASAGSLVSLLAATAYVSGIDPVAFLRTAWVDSVSLELLFEGSDRAPLGSDGLRRRLRELVLDWEASGPIRAPSPVVLSFSLTGLRGLSYRVDGLRGENSVPAVTYDDWGTFTLEPGFDRRTLFEPDSRSAVDVALASAANPAVFAPKLLDRSGERDAYRRAGITDLPEHGRLWFSDGGLIQSEPVGRVIEAAACGQAENRHVVLLVHPRSEGPSTGARWSDPENPPEWLHGLSRALELIPAKNLYDDLRRVVRDNRRLRLRDELVGVLAEHLPSEAAEDLDGVLASHTGRDLPDDLHGLLLAALGEVGGVEDKSPYDVDVLSPLLLTDGERDMETVLAGQVLGDFGGFLDQRLRDSDFVLGYATTLAWLPDGLAAAGIESRLAESTVEAVADAHDHDWRAHNWGGISVSELPATSQTGLLRLLARVITSATGEFLPVGISERLRRFRGRSDEPLD